MKCSESKKLIYLYEELSVRDRVQIDKHIHECMQCSELLEQVTAERNMLRQMLTTPLNPSTGKLTDSIMAALQKEHEPEPEVSIIQRIFQLFEPQPVRYALTMVSLFLIVFFVSELAEAPYPAESVAFNQHARQNETVELNSALYYEEWKEAVTAGKSLQAGSTLSLYDCIQSCKVNQRNTKCITCKIKYAKLNQYEGI